MRLSSTRCARRRALRQAGAAVGAAFGLLLGTQGVLAAPAAAAEPETITVVLKAPDRAGLAALAQASGISREERLRRLAPLLPTSSQKDAVVDQLEDQGFTITEVGTWLINATAPTQAAQARANGMATSSAQSAGTGSLTGLASAVYTTDHPGPERKHAAVPYGPTGAALRNSYSSNQPASNTDATIATLQYAGWNPADLSSYASSIGVGDPVASGRYTGVAVSPRHTTNRLSQDGDGDSEVALDQQALLSVAPNLKQRAYFAANSSQGELNALQRIADDATASTYNLVALSISWGLCEDNYYNGDGSVDTDGLNAEIDAFNAIAAAGVTIFAASGDSGAYDCAGPGDFGSITTEEQVDTPGAFPSVVSVGGTSLQVNNAFTPDDDVETGWNDPSNDGAGAYLGSAGGGGISKLVARPDYQRSTGYSKRTVPDIAALADPSDRFAVYWGRGGGWMGVGGTSLAAPLSAGLFANEVISHGQTQGIGSIHEALYGNPTYSGSRPSMRDITVGDISFGRNSIFTARPGYDLSTGLGSPRWGEVVTRALESVTISAPVATRSTNVTLSVLNAASTSFTSWKIQALNASAPDPGCMTGTTATSTRPTQVTLPGGDGEKVIYVAAFEDGSTDCVASHATIRLDTVNPTLSLSAKLASPTTNKVNVSWAGFDVTGSGIDHYAVKITHSLQSASDVNYSSTQTTSYSLSGVAGRTYKVTVTAYDKAGNSRTASQQLDVPLDDTYLSSNGSWKRVSSTSHFGSAAMVSSTKSSSLSGRVTYRTLSVMVATGRNNGRIDVWVDNKLVKTIDTYSPSTTYRKVIAVQSLTSTGAHNVAIKVRGDRSLSSKGITAVIDGLLLHS